MLSQKLLGLVCVIVIGGECVDDMKSASRYTIILGSGVFFIALKEQRKVGVCVLCNMI